MERYNTKQMTKKGPFETNTDEYEEWFEENRFVYEAELRAVKKLLPTEGESIEIGVGSGRFAVPLGIRLGIDPSLKMAEIAVKQGIKVHEGVAEDLPFDDSRFDFALMVTAICFLKDAKTALREAYRILKPRGSLVIGLVDRISPLGKKYEKYKAGNKFYREASFYSTDEVVSLMTDAGFGNFAFTQTIFRDLKDIDNTEAVKEGYGEGSFIVIRGEKQGLGGGN
ncbi:MAG: class I SAM-dependent methyltransferase [Syntrophobacterales bacterium]|nr:class I SAM-dependent methyltransferase [Syntrophobacterales bacterium]